MTLKVFREAYNSEPSLNNAEHALDALDAVCFLRLILILLSVPIMS